MLFDPDISDLYSDSPRDDDFVGFAIHKLSSGEYSHCAFVIQIDNEISEFHFLNKIELNCPPFNGYCYKVADIIDKRLVPSFYAMCKRIKSHANPKYGYFYSGEYYLSTGKHFSESQVGETMTCVGFCLNTLKGFLKQDYIYHLDWDSNSHHDTNWLDTYIKTHRLNKNDIIDSHKRITPLEFFISAYFTKLPIRKKQIDDFQTTALNYIENSGK